VLKRFFLDDEMFVRLFNEVIETFVKTVWFERVVAEGLERRTD
jgi:hypothetical protein